MVYSLLFCFISLFAVTDWVDSSKKKYLIMCFFIFVLSFFAGMRGESVGNDYWEYVSIFRAVSDVRDVINGSINYSEIHGEFLYASLNTFIKIFSTDYFWLFLIVAVLSVSINLYHIRKYSPFIVLSILLYFSHVYFYKEFIQIRAGLAGAILFFSIKYIEQRNFLKFSCVVIVASLVHTASLVLFGVYFLSFFKLSKTKAICLILLAVIIGSISWVHVTLNHLVELGYVPQSILNYVYWERYNYSLGLLNPVSVKQILVLVFLTFYREKLAEHIKDFNAMYYMYFCSTLWIIIFNEFAILAARVATFMSIAEFILIPAVILLFRQKKFMYSIVYLLCFLMFYLNIFIKEVVNDYYIIGGSW